MAKSNKPTESKTQVAESAESKVRAETESHPQAPGDAPEGGEASTAPMPDPVVPTPTPEGSSLPPPPDGAATIVSTPPQPTDGDRLAAARKGRDVSPDMKARTQAEVREQELTKQLEHARQELATAKTRITQLERKMEEMRRVGVHGARPLSPQQVREKLQANPHTEFVVLEPYSHMNTVLKANRVLRGQLYPQLVAYVQNGLKLVEHKE